MNGPVVIVGASLAGGTAAVTLRDQGYDGDIVLIGAEPRAPYERPPLSKEYLRGQQPFEKAYVKPPDHWSSNGVETRFGVTAERIDTDRREVVLAGGERIPYGTLLITTGCRTRKIPAPGSDLDGVLDLRTVADADRIREAAASSGSAVVVGLGFIGAEVTASLKQTGLDVTAVEFAPVPLNRVLGEDVGRALAGLHADNGVHTIFEDSVASFEGSGRVEAVVTAQGTRLPCDVAVVGVGVQPNVEIAEGSPIAVDNGILVDEYCRTNVDGVYAAGDVANHQHPLFGRRMRVEHWQNAMRQGAAAAKSMLGAGEPYAEVHWFWSDQFDANLQYAGYHTAWDDLVVRGSIPDRNFIAFYTTGGLIDAAVALNRGKELRRAMALIKARAPIDPAKLRDEDVDLKTLAG
jgi:3-phenylpropionate/trans-cinnamate dioxygenase ferredoxin reductase subunit